MQLVGLALALPTVALAGQTTGWPEVEEWVPLTIGGVPVSDPAADSTLAAATPAIDLVGTVDLPGALWMGDDTHLFLRTRLGADPALGGAWPGSWVWMGLVGDTTAAFSWRGTLAVGAWAGDLNGLGVEGLVVPPGAPIFAYDRDTSGTIRTVPVGDGSADVWLDVLFFPADLALTADTPFRLAAAAGATGGLTLPGADQWAGDDADGLDHLSERWSDTITLDGDLDGLPTALEIRTGTDPLAADSDLGGRADGEEDRDHDGVVGPWETDPRDGLDDPDTDHDAIADALEHVCTGTEDLVSDSDDDGVSDTTEGLADHDADGLPDFCDTDDDGDTIPTLAEGDADPDGDDIPAYLDEDSDGDGIPDSLEGGDDEDCDNAPDYADAIADDGPCADPDADGLDNGTEDACGSDPGARDSDGDGLDDAAESCTTDADCDQVPDRIDGTTDTGFCVTDADDPEDTACTDANPEDPWHDCPGSLTGGGGLLGCTSAPGPTIPGFGWLLAALGLARRRRSTLDG